MSVAKKAYKHQKRYTYTFCTLIDHGYCRLTAELLTDNDFSLMNIGQKCTQETAILFSELCPIYQDRRALTFALARLDDMNHRHEY